MFSSKTLKTLVVAAFLGGALVFTSGCSWKPSDEDKAKLENAKAAAESAEQKLSDLQQQNRTLEQDLAQKQRTAEQCEKDKAAVEQRLQNWQ